MSTGGSGRYEVEGTLAEGGMARVLLATQHGAGGFRKRVVLKRVLPHLAQVERFGAMFLDEARIAADLRHPNVVMLLDAGRDTEDLYITLEFLDGVDAHQIARAWRLRGEPVPLAASVCIVADAAAGLAYVHDKVGLDGEPLCIVHRDISPSNLFVTVSGHTKVLDFGIAHARNQISITEAGVLKGKCGYMSPEHLLGDPLDGRSDQFALGVVLWELSVGRYLFWNGNEVDSLRRVLECNVPKPSSIVPGYPPELERLVVKALAAKPADRFVSCADLGDALEEVEANLGLLGRRAARACVRQAQAAREVAPPTALTRVDRRPRALVPDGESSWPASAPAHHDALHEDMQPTSILAGSPGALAGDSRPAHADVARVARAMVDGSDVTALDRSRLRAIAPEALAAARALVHARRAEALAPAIVAEIALEPHDGRALLDQALQLASVQGDASDLLLRARGLELLGDRDKRRGDVPAARRAYRDAIALCAPGAPDPDRAREAALLRSVAWRNLADLELDGGELRAAEDAARVACQAARTSESRIALARSTWTLARTALVRGELDEAELLLDRCGRIFMDEGDQRFAGRVQFERARVCEARGDFELAAALFENAFDAHLANHDLVYAARAKEALGIVASWRGQLDAAVAHLEEARARALALEDTAAVARIEGRQRDVTAARLAPA